MATPYAPYVEVGTHKDGEWVQLNTNILQIENEYYSNIRPKRVTYTGERPIQALMARGIQYVEVRCLDINPFMPLGIDVQEARFLDAFLLYCALNDSPLFENNECGNATSNFLSVVKEGRRPGLQLQRRGQAVDMKEWAAELLEGIAPLAALLDQSHGSDEHSKALDAQLAKVKDSSLTPSAQVLATMTERRKASASSPCARAWPTPSISAARPWPRKNKRRSKRRRASPWNSRSSWNRTKWAISTSSSAPTRPASWLSATDRHTALPELRSYTAPSL